MAEHADDFEQEPCPHCEGTGFRLVPPPPASAGRQPTYGKGRRHGYQSTYQAGCRCDLCRAAWREYARSRSQAKSRISGSTEGASDGR